MKHATSVVVLVGLSAVLAVTATTRAGAAEDAPGLALFKKSGCNECHAISSLGIEKKKPAEPAAGAAAETKKKKDAPDLSGVGLEREAKWISAFLNKEEAIDGEKHEKRFKGTEAERRTIAMWLATLKTETKKTDANAEKAGAEGEAKDKGE